MLQAHTIRWFEEGGVRHRLNAVPIVSRNVRGLRGSVKGCSSSSRRRLRQFLIQNEGSCSLPEWALTLTVRMVAGPDQWRKVWRAFRQRVIRLRVPFVWRVELQRRGTPHLHCCVWCEESCVETLRQNWLQVWGVENDLDHIAHAVEYRPLLGAAWYGYMILHAQKHLDGQGNAWTGRQWGVVNARMFRQRACEEWQLSPGEYEHCRGMLDRFYRMRGRNKELPQHASWDHVGGDRFTVAQCVERSRIWWAKQLDFKPGVSNG